MTTSALFAKAICLQPNEQLIIHFANGNEFSGQIILSHDIFLLPEHHKERIRRVLRMITKYVTLTETAKRKCVKV
jgi:hypothetical protein